MGIIGVILAKAGSSEFLETAYTLDLLHVKGEKKVYWWHCGEHTVHKT